MSMTGFGREAIDAPFGRLIIEIQSVNRKHFEVHVHLPKELLRFENEMRKWVSEEVERGHVSLRIHLTPSASAIADLLPDPEILKSLKSGWEKIAKLLKLDPKNIDLRFLIDSLPLAQKGDLVKEIDLPVLQKGIKKALSSMAKMKAQEGKALIQDIKARLEAIQKMGLSIEKLSPEAVSRMREKLTEKMKMLFPSGLGFDERVLKEAALFAEKVDIAEELIRLKSHWEQFRECFDAKGAVGRKMEFIVQEMGREINTIGSKSSEPKISYLVVEMKSELEKIREQIQNIE